MNLDNPAGTDGFAFVEFASPRAGDLKILLDNLGFQAVAHHKTKPIILYRQGEINFLVNEEPQGFAVQFAATHGPSACSLAFRVKDAAKALRHAVSCGAESVEGLSLPAIRGIGGSLLYFVDTSNTLYDTEFTYFPGVDPHPQGKGLKIIDHLTHNVFQGRMDHWADFYHRLFNFHEQRYFTISGEKTGLLSRAMRSPCGKIRIPINESQDDISQIAEYLREYKGEGIQHIALTTLDIVDSVSTLSRAGVPFMKIPDTYYEVMSERLPNHGLDITPLKKLNILIDGEIDPREKKLLLQIFTETVIGPIFFEIIQRMGHEGFGEGNFSALFEALERDQVHRGVI